VLLFLSGAQLHRPEAAPLFSVQFLYRSPVVGRTKIQNPRTKQPLEFGSWEFGSSERADSKVADDRSEFGSF
jgi:hypothetical protein